MEEKIKDIKNRATKILKSSTINLLTNEREILDILNKIQNSDNINIEYDSKTLDYIERYMIAKEKMLIAENDTQFLNNLSKELKSQEVRATDMSTPPLFIIKDAIGRDIFFLTRKAVENYTTISSKSEKRLIEVPSSDSLEISQLVDIIKRNF